MKIWAISDLHLSFGVPGKSMEIFGKEWEGYPDKIASNWRKAISDNDLVLIAGDVSWATHLEEALLDLQWIDALPGTKVLIKGNHDYWWGSLAKVKEVMPPSIHVIQNDVFVWNGVAVGGTRLWDTNEYNFAELIHYKEQANSKVVEIEIDREKIYERELGRLKLSLSQMPANASFRIALTHYPPIGVDLKDTRASAILEEFKVQACIFGHLHSLKKKQAFWGEKNSIRYFLTSCDVLNFAPLSIDIPIRNLQHW